MKGDFEKKARKDGQSGRGTLRTIKPNQDHPSIFCCQGWMNGRLVRWMTGWLPNEGIFALGGDITIPHCVSVEINKHCLGVISAIVYQQPGNIKTT